jgi:hypothetical protein
MDDIQVVAAFQPSSGCELPSPNNGHGLPVIFDSAESATEFSSQADWSRTSISP